MTKLIGKRGLKETQIDEIEAVLNAVNGRAERWTASVSDVLDMIERAESRLENSDLPASRRSGATAVCYTDTPSKAYKYGVKGNVVCLRRATDGWRITDISTVWLYGGDSRGDKVKISLRQEQIDYIRNKSVSYFDVQKAA